MTRDGRAERWRDHREQRREAFLDAAFHALARHGSEVTMADIAAEAGVAKPRLYRYFADKNDLFIAVAERSLRALEERMLPALDPALGPKRAIRTAVAAYVHLVAENPNVAWFLIGSGFVDRSHETDPVIGNSRKVAAVLARLFATNLPSGAAGATAAWAHATVGAVRASTEWWLRTRDLDENALIDYLTTFLWGGMDAALRSEGIALDPDEPIDLVGVKGRV